MPFVLIGPLGHAVNAESMGIEAYEVHIPSDCLQKLLLAFTFLDFVGQGMLMFICLDVDNATLNPHDKVYPDVAPGVPIEPYCNLTPEINASGLKVAFHALLMDLDPLAPTTLLMTVASATVPKATAA